LIRRRIFTRSFKLFSGDSRVQGMETFKRVLKVFKDQRERKRRRIAFERGRLSANPRNPQEDEGHAHDFDGT
jgi:hypothetical protein